ncbi:hypothetical protein [Adlercreutzia sp.]|uniref:hypothetical protein n=1 Tax=Adlercreutzia sp. TaxID=1872387 RepID=UPI003AB291BF
MTDKDPKDMTASELVRWATNGEPYNGVDGSRWTYLTEKIKALVEDVTGKWPSDHEAFSIIADKIDAELAEARKDAIRESRKPMWWFRSAIKCGYDWPEPRDGEKFRDYLHRCFLPRPRYEDGEPVQSSDMEEIGAFATYRVYMDGSWEFEPDKYEDETSPKLWDVQFGAKSERVKRPAPEALGADGLPIVEGETVWLDEAHSRCAGSCGFEDGNKYSLCGIERQEMLTVEDAHIEVDGREYVRVCTCGAWCHASWLTHTPPETQERIDDDATLSPREYYNAHIGHDVGLKDDEEMAVAMVHDLLRRQRELDKRTGGE